MWFESCFACLNGWVATDEVEGMLDALGGTGIWISSCLRLYIPWFSYLL